MIDVDGWMCTTLIMARSLAVHPFLRRVFRLVFFVVAFLVVFRGRSHFSSPSDRLMCWSFFGCCCGNARKKKNVFSYNDDRLIGAYM